MEVAAPGRAPEGIDGIRFRTRPYARRARALRPIEVAALEILRDPDSAEVSWPAARAMRNRSSATRRPVSEPALFGALWLRQTSGMSLWEQPVRDVRPLAVAERERLLQFLTGLSAEEWLDPTAAPGWRVKDVALHLLDDDMTWLSTQRDGDLSGIVNMSDQESFPRRLAAKNQRWIDGASGMSRRVVSDLLRWSGEQVDLLHVSKDLQGEGRVSWASDEPVPYWFNLAQEFTERWVHQQQMREAVDRVENHADYLPEVLRTFVWALPHQLPTPTDASQVIAVTIDHLATWTLTPNTHDGWNLSEGPAGNPTATVRVSLDVAWRWFVGAHMPTDQFTVGGLPELADAVMQVRAIIA